MAKTYTSNEVLGIWKKVEEDKIKTFEAELQGLRKREVAKALVPPHKHDEGMTASGGVEDVPGSRMIGKGGMCKSCGKSEELCKCMGKAMLSDSKGKRVDSGIAPESKLPDDKKSKHINKPAKSDPGSGGVIGKAKSLKGLHKGALKAEPPMAKPPSGKNMGTAVPTSKPMASPKMGGMAKDAIHEQDPVTSAADSSSASFSEKSEMRKDAMTDVGAKPMGGKKPGIFGRLHGNMHAAATAAPGGMPKPGLPKPIAPAPANHAAQAPTKAGAFGTQVAKPLAPMPTLKPAAVAAGVQQFGQNKPTVPGGMGADKTNPGRPSAMGTSVKTTPSTGATVPGKK